MKTAATCADAAEKALTAFKSGALAAFHELEVWALPAPGLAENPTDAPTGEAIQVAPAEEQSLAPAAALAA
eukprot:CAMPEP_0117589762 /NCGR_PEP_ID=MMETSP0784-20121206/70591_1 /TAXON_ID=39447 /ORGANISM="" /LENGTH=70 /DNA_ID=CAMNT_0005391277 /DNA_START=49 /DNA_END=261 /DNA_ORIENTATION=+